MEINAIVSNPTYVTGKFGPIGPFILGPRGPRAHILYTSKSSPDKLNKTSNERKWPKNSKDPKFDIFFIIKKSIKS